MKDYKNLFEAVIVSDDIGVARQLSDRLSMGSDKFGNDDVFRQFIEDMMWLELEVFDY
jgi:hypothetical protein